jgi:nitrate reductase NapAB chaperone NapD
MTKNAELDALVTSLKLMSRFYTDAEVNNRGDWVVIQSKYPDMVKDLLAQIGKVERVIASSLTDDDADEYDGLYGHKKVDDKSERLLVLATKHCPKEHHDWQEILRIYGAR